MKTINWFYLILLLTMVASCNDSFEDEQYYHYVSFKAPATTVTQIRLKYKPDEKSVYHLPLIVSGTTVNQKNLEVHVGIDNDTLEIFNREHYYDRTDLYYRQLEDNFYNIPSYDVSIPAGETQALMDIQFSFEGLDLSDKWVLPLIIKDSPSYNYKSNPRKNYNNALLWITPFNDFSGKYGSTNLSVYLGNSQKPIVEDTREAYVVDANTVFFYAGAVSETRPDRKKFKLYATFNSNTENSGTITLRADNPDIKLNVNSQPTYTISEMMDSYRPYLLRRTVTIENLDYTFEDPWETEGYIANYKVKGTMTLQRNINTTIPDEEFAIEW